MDPIVPIEIPGTAFQPGFSVYIIEVIVDDVPFGYYIGMTGDGHYPSARSSFHRLAGHFDRSAASTQNQLGRVLAEEMADVDYRRFKVKKYSVPVSGFVPISGATKRKGDETYFKAERFKPQYDAYLGRREAVAALEDNLIYLFKSDPTKRCLNKTSGKRCEITCPELHTRFIQVREQFNLQTPT